IVTRHGMTVGELAHLYQAELGLGELRVIPCDGWRRGMDFDATSYPWVLPSPNMPTVDTAIVYPGQCLIEGTNLSEGRGTTRPFELCGAPGVDAVKLCRGLNEQGLSGVAFRPAWFQPTFQKHAGQRVAGFQMHVTDRHSFSPVRTSLALLAAFRAALGERCRWRRGGEEFIRDKPAIDIPF